MDGSAGSEAPVVMAQAALEAATERLRQEKAELSRANERLRKELTATQQRLSFVEELVGPTETQRKKFQLQLTAAREASLRVAHSCAGSIPTRCVGRLDEGWLRMKGLTDAECSMLQRGCVAGDNGVPCDISLLGDPLFSPYEQETLQPKWDAKGGFLRLSLGDIREKWGEEVAMEIVRCAIELDRHDGSRRLGVELPWHEKDDREMEIAEIIGLLGQQLLIARCSCGNTHSGGCEEDEDSEWGGLPRSEAASPDETVEGGASRAWSMLEAMMSDLGLNPRQNQQPLLPLPFHSHATQVVDDLDEEVIAEALEDESRAEAIAEEDIQQMLHEPSVQVVSGQTSTQQKTRTSRTLLTPSGNQTPCTSTPMSATRGTRATSSSREAEEPEEPGLGEVELALPHEVSTNEALFLQLLEDEVAGGLTMYLPGASPSSSSGSEGSNQ